MALSLGDSTSWTGTGAGTKNSSSRTTQAASAFVIDTAVETGNFTAVGDNKSNSFSQVGSTLTTGFGIELRRHLCMNGAGGASHIFNIQVTAGFPSAWMTEVRGAALASALDGNTGQNDTGTPFTSGTITPTASTNVFLLGLIVSASGENPATYTPGNGFTNLGVISDGTAFWTGAQAYRIVTSTSGSYEASFTGSAGVSSTGVLVLALKEAAGGAAALPGALAGGADRLKSLVGGALATRSMLARALAAPFPPMLLERGLYMPRRKVFLPSRMREVA